MKIRWLIFIKVTTHAVILFPAVIRFIAGTKRLTLLEYWLIMKDLNRTYYCSVEWGALHVQLWCQNGKRGIIDWGLRSLKKLLYLLNEWMNEWMNEWTFIFYMWKQNKKIAQLVRQVDIIKWKAHYKVYSINKHWHAQKGAGSMMG